MIAGYAVEGTLAKEIMAQPKEVVTLEGQAKANYLAAAREKTWERMKGLMADSPMGDGQYDDLIAHFYDAARDQ
mgnify:CR=1 FL=1